MELNNEFRVSVPIDQAWAVLTDLERIAPCMPGAQLQEVEGDEYRGVVKIKVGPITAQYKGKASFVELDGQNHRAVLKAEGRDTRGQGNASATVRAELDGDQEGTQVRILTDLAVTGKVAQFGRGVLADVSAKLLDQFVASLEKDVLSGPAPASSGPVGSAADSPSSNGSGVGRSQPPSESGATSELDPSGAGVGSRPSAAAPPATPAPSGPSTGGVRTIHSAPAQPVNLLDAAGSSVAKRLVPAGLGLVVLLILWRVLRGR